MNIWLMSNKARETSISDYVNDPRSSIVDGPSTMVVDGTHVKIYAWYDNEWGYVNRMMEIAKKLRTQLKA